MTRNVWYITMLAVIVGFAVIIGGAPPIGG